jgi:hypothetical protein
MIGPGSWVKWRRTSKNRVCAPFCQAPAERMMSLASMRMKRTFCPSIGFHFQLSVHGEAPD